MIHNINNPTGSSWLYSMCLIPNFDYDSMPYAFAMNDKGINIIDVKKNKAYHIINNKYDSANYIC